jgi:hypothetical protein
LFIYVKVRRSLIKLLLPFVALMMASVAAPIIFRCDTSGLGLLMLFALVWLRPGNK